MTNNITDNAVHTKLVHKNVVDLAGELFNDPIVRRTATGKEVLNCTIVAQLKTSTEYFKVVIWPPLGSKVAGLHKGDFVAVTGRLKTSSWTDKQSGEKRYRTEVIAFKVVLPGESTEAATSGTGIARSILRPAQTEVSDDISF